MAQQEQECIVFLIEIKSSLEVSYWKATLYLQVLAPLPIISVITFSTGGQDYKRKREQAT